MNALFYFVCQKTCEIGGYTIPEGQVINTGIWAIHHDEKYWPDPEKFDPDRYDVKILIPISKLTRFSGS